MLLALRYLWTAGPTSYSLSCAAGSYSIAGVASTSNTARVITAASGTYAITGVAATTAITRTIAAAAGSYTYTGQVSHYGYVPRVVQFGQYNYTGVAATLTLTRAGINYTLTCAAGAYSVSGVAASFNVSLSVQAAPGAYAITGQAATLTKSGAQALTLVCDAGSYSITGNSSQFFTSQQYQRPNTDADDTPKRRKKAREVREVLEGIIDPQPTEIVAADIAQEIRETFMDVAAVERDIQRVEQILKKSRRLDDEAAILLLIG
jgi:hypothetical protein